MRLVEHLASCSCIHRRRPLMVLALLGLFGTGLPQPALARQAADTMLAQAAAPAPAPEASTPTPATETPTPAAATPAAATETPAPALVGPASPSVGTPAAPMAAGTAAALPPAKFDVISMVMHADIVVQCVMGFLILCSIATWTILLQKSLLLRQARRSSVAFLTGFREARTVHDIALKTTSAVISPISKMWNAAKAEWDLFQTSHAGGQITPHQADGLVQRMSVAANIAQESEMLRMSSSMGILATIGSTAPFIGLFGTVWGILTSFVGIAATKATSLSAVAPGIAEALLATAIGLVAAIPAVMIYNKFARQISQVSGMLDNFQGELATVVSRELEVVG